MVQQPKGRPLGTIPPGQAQQLSLIVGRPLDRDHGTPTLELVWARAATARPSDIHDDASDTLSSWPGHGASAPRQHFDCR